MIKDFVIVLKMKTTIVPQTLILYKKLQQEATIEKTTPTIERERNFEHVIAIKLKTIRMLWFICKRM